MNGPDKSNGFVILFTMRLQPFILIITLISSLLRISISQAQSKNNHSETHVAVDSHESVPHFPGGQDSLASFLQKNLHWPEPYIDAQGTTIVEFIVTKTGKIKNAKVVKKLFASFDAEALRVVRLMPAWVPAKIKGNPIDKKYYLPISFTIKSN